MAEKSQIAIYISLGSLAISFLSLLFALRQSKITRNNERVRIYDKVYHDASELLLYQYKNEQEALFESDDKDLERAVNEFSNYHFLEQIYGYNFCVPENIKTKEEKREFCKKVSDTYYAHQQEKHMSGFDEFLNYQSPVFHLGNDEFSTKFSRLMEHVTENLSYFSPVIIENWEQMRFLTPEKVKNEYLALKRVNEHACEPIEESIEDPYLKLLLSIRHEYRQLNKPFKTKWSEFWFDLYAVKYRVKRLFSK